MNGTFGKVALIVSEADGTKILLSILEERADVSEALLDFTSNDLNEPPNVVRRLIIGRLIISIPRPKYGAKAFLFATIAL